MEKKIYMYSLVKEWQSSEMTKRDFANLKSITYDSFSYWVKKYNIEQANSSTGDKSDISFFSAPIDIKKKKSKTLFNSIKNKTISIELPGGIKISIY